MRSVIVIINKRIYDMINHYPAITSRAQTDRQTTLS